MVILSIGMPRAGSGWYYNLTNALMMANGAQDTKEIRRRFHLQKILTEVNCNIGSFTFPRTIAVALPSLVGNTFVVKAHAGPTHSVLTAIRIGLMHPIYIYRDPRDVILSAMEIGQKAIGKGQNNAFSPLVDFERAVEFMLKYLCIWEAWMNCSQALHTRYEDLLTNYDREIERLTDFLEINSAKTEIQRVFDQYRPEKTHTDQKGMHFSQGKIGRFRQKMSPEEQQRMMIAFKPYLQQMDYPA